MSRAHLTVTGYAKAAGPQSAVDRKPFSDNECTPEIESARDFDHAGHSDAISDSDIE